MSWLKNSGGQYSAVAKGFHWLTAFVVVILFALGLWMVELGYYHEWYQKAPNLHMSIGVILALLTLLRLLYRSIYAYPPPLVGTPPKLQLVAKSVHIGLYLLLLGLFTTGYLIVTAEGDALPVFGLVHIPAIVHSDDNLQDQMGEIHEWVAYVLIAVTIIHGGAALWHHFWGRDDTLLRMLTKAKGHL